MLAAVRFTLPAEEIFERRKFLLNTGFGKVYKETMDTDSEARPTVFADSSTRAQCQSTKERRPTVCEGCAFKAEIFESRQQAGYWQSRHQQALEREEKLRQEVQQLRAEIHKLERQIFGRKSEKKLRYEDFGEARRLLGRISDFAFPYSS